MHVIILFISTIFLTSCSNKVQDLSFEKPSNSLYIEVINDKEDSNLLEKLKNKFENSGIKISDDNETRNSLSIEIISSNIVDKKTATSEILSNSNIQISIGQVFGSVGVRGTFGTKAGNIFDVNSTYKVYKMLVDVKYTNEKKQEDSTLISEYESIEYKSKDEAKNLVENKVVNKIFDLFYNKP